MKGPLLFCHLCHSFSCLNLQDSIMGPSKALLPDSHRRHHHVICHISNRTPFATRPAFYHSLCSPSHTSLVNGSWTSVISPRSQRGHRGCCGDGVRICSASGPDIGSLFRQRFG